MGYTPTIGLEIHAELNTKSKMFCGCKNAPHGSEPNTLICPVCMAHPGTLPVPNMKAIENLLLFGEAVGADQATFSEFDRKSYFYPDIPKAYQISQYKFPFLTNGKISDVALTRVHLEEDTARSQHSDDGYSLVDFNRAGVPLMELVTEPVIHDPETAVAFAKELQLLLRLLNISDANMEKGEMRVEANISVSKDDTLGTKVEVKNLNSFKVVGQAIEFEINRQIASIEAGEAVKQETRGWNEAKNKTFSQRSKETAKDYRYFPDPDLTKMDLTLVATFNKASLAQKMPKLPNKIRDEYKNLGLTNDQIEQSLARSEVLRLLESIRALGVSNNFKLTANYILTDFVTLVDSSESISFTDLNLKELMILMSMIEAGEINSRIAKDLLPKVIEPEIDIREFAEDNNLLQVQDSDALEALVDTVIADNSDVAEECRNGKDAALKYLVGQGMKLSKGTANPEMLLNLIKQKLK